MCVFKRVYLVNGVMSGYFLAWTPHARTLSSYRLIGRREGDDPGGAAAR